MRIDIDPSAFDTLVRAWLNDKLGMWEYDLKHNHIHPDDVKDYKKDIKAVKRLLDYIGPNA